MHEKLGEHRQFARMKRQILIKTALTLLLVVFVLINSIGLFAGNLIYEEVCLLNTHFRSERFKNAQLQFDKAKQQHHWEDVSIQSPFGYPLHGTLLTGSEPSRGTVIIVHGLSANRLMGMWYADIYLDMNFNVLVYDSRAHGESGGETVTYGYYERYDLDKWVAWAKERQPDGIIGVHGVSLGAATALLQAELNERSHLVRFYVADCPFSDLETLLRLQFGQTFSFWPPWLIRTLIDYASFATWLQAGFSYREVSPVQAVRHVTAPVLFLHGSNDALIPSVMSEELYENAAGYKEIHLFPGIGHARAIFDRQREYRNLIRQFVPTALTRS